MTSLKLLVLVSTICILSLMNVGHAQPPGAYFTDDFMTLANFTAKWTNSTAVSVGTPFASILNFSNGEVVSRTSFFQGIIEIRANASSEGDFFGFSDGPERLGFISDANQYYFVSQNVTASSSPLSLGSVDEAFHVFALVWFYVDTSSGPQQYAQACFDGTCSRSWRVQSPETPIPKNTLPITFTSNSTFDPLQVDWVTYSYNGVFVSPFTVTNSITLTKSTTTAETFTSSTLMAFTRTSLIVHSASTMIKGSATSNAYTVFQTERSSYTNTVTRFLTSLTSTGSLSQHDFAYLVTGIAFLAGALLAYLASQQETVRKKSTQAKLLSLIPDLLPLFLLLILLLNLRLVLTMTSKYLALLGFTLLQAALALIFPILYDFPKAVGKAAIILIDDMHQKLTETKMQMEPPPGVSVIVPAHNEERVIENCVSSILESDYEPKEVIVIDDGSEDATYDKLLEMSRVNQRITVLRKEKSGNRATPCNFATQFAKQPIYVFIDGDTLMFRNAITQIVRPFQDPTVVGVAGNVRIYNTSNLITKMQAYEYMLSMECGRRFQSIAHTLLVVPGGFGALRATSFRQIGGYDVSLAEDMDATLKMHKTRGKIVFAKDAIALTFAPEKWKTWIRQRDRWSSGQIEVLRRHRNILFRRLFGMPGLFGIPEMILSDVIILYARFIWLALLLFWKWYDLPQILALVFSFYAGLELVAAYVACVTTSLKRDVKYVLLLPLIILIYRPFNDVVRLIAYSAELLHKRSAAW